MKTKILILFLALSSCNSSYTYWARVRVNNGTDSSYVINVDLSTNEVNAFKAGDVIRIEGNKTCSNCHNPVIGVIEAMEQYTK